MKIKTVLLCAVFAGAMLLGGCTADKGEESDGTVTTTNNTTITEESTTPETTTEDATDTDPFTNEAEDTTDNDMDKTTTSEISGDAGDITPVMGEMTENSKIGWGLGSAKDTANRPVDAVKAQEIYGGYDAVFIGNMEKEIYLTFDEGYENGFTEKILDTLKEKNVKAAFFVTMDYCKSSPEIVKRMIAEGHSVGNHTVSHPSMPDCSDEQVKKEITELHEYVKENFGYEMTLFRFPMGEYSERCLSLVQSLGYKSVFWSFAYADWDVNNQPSPDAAVHKISYATHDGAVFLLHAVSSTNAEILPELIDFWKGQGYTLGSLA